MTYLNYFDPLQIATDTGNITNFNDTIRRRLIFGKAARWWA